MTPKPIPHTHVRKIAALERKLAAALEHAAEERRLRMEVLHDARFVMRTTFDYCVAGGTAHLFALRLRKILDDNRARAKKEKP